VLWALIGGLMLVFGQASKRVVLAGLGATVLVHIIADTAMQGFDYESLIADSRVGSFFGKLASGDILYEVIDDESMYNRIRESSDALRTRFEYQGPFTWVLGSGHGAAFDGLTAQYGERLLSNGESHHIHFGLVLLYYRYGIPGLIGYAWLLTLSFRHLVALRRCDTRTGINRASLIFTIATIAYLMNFLICNEMVNPVVSYTLAGFLLSRDLQMRIHASACRRWRRQEQPLGKFGSALRRANTSLGSTECHT
jgi:hypothetical protein